MNAFLQQASGWVDAQIGALAAAETEDGHPAWRATGPDLDVLISRPAAGNDAEARLVMVFGT